MAASVTGLMGTSGIHKAFSPAAVSFSSLAAVQKRQRWDPGSHFTGEASGVPSEGLLLAQAVHRQAQHQSFSFAHTQVLFVSVLSAGQFLLFANC